MNVLLVNPNPKVWHAPKVPPLGIGYVAASLERAGHRVRIWDAVVDDRKPSWAGWDVVGATAVTPQIREAWRILGEAKQNGAFTVIGGPHPTCLPEESAARPEVDAVVRREGEETLPALLEAVSVGREAAGVPGVTWRRADGTIVNEPDAPPVADLDALPFPAHHLFPPLTRYTNPQPLLSPRAPALAIFTSRGCPYGCAFCYKGTFGYGFRARSVESVLEEWELLVRRYGVREIAVQDDIFNFDPTRAIKICREISRRGLQVPWSTPNGLRADRVSEELFEAMVEAGCERVAFGVESGNQDVLDRLGKHESLDQIREAFRLAHRAGLRTTGFFMFGNLGETADTMADTVSFALELNPTWAQFTMATPYPGTRLYASVLRDGERLETDWERYGHYTSRAFFRMGSLTPEVLHDAMRRAYRAFYLRLPWLRRFGTEDVRFKNLWTTARGAWHLLARA